MKSVAAFFIGLLVALPGSAKLVTEIYQTCNAAEGELARCGPGANCFIIDNLPTCHCVVDAATGLPLAGNPYRGCTWDISGIWQVYSFQLKNSGFQREVLNPVNNEPIIIRLDRTDAVLKTKYMTAAIFVVTALTASSVGLCTRAFLDVNDNSSILFEQAEGFLDQWGRSVLLRTLSLDNTLVKRHPILTSRKDGRSLLGKWQKNDGNIVTIFKMKSPKHSQWPNRKRSYMFHPKYSYWYNDRGFGAPLLRLSMAAFLDETLKVEKQAFETSARFVQVGWLGLLRFGSNRIDVFSPADGGEIFTLRRLDTMPPLVPIGAGTALSEAFRQRTYMYEGVEAEIIGGSPVLPLDPQSMQSSAGYPVDVTPIVVNGATYPTQTNEFPPLPPNLGAVPGMGFEGVPQRMYQSTIARPLQLPILGEAPVVPERIIGRLGRLLYSISDAFSSNKWAVTETSESSTTTTAPTDMANTTTVTEMGESVDGTKIGATLGYNTQTNDSTRFTDGTGALFPSRRLAEAIATNDEPTSWSMLWEMVTERLELAEREAEKEFEQALGMSIPWLS